MKLNSASIVRCGLFYTYKLSQVCYIGIVGADNRFEEVGRGNLKEAVVEAI